MSRLKHNDLDTSSAAADSANPPLGLQELWQQVQLTFTADLKEHPEITKFCTSQKYRNYCRFLDPIWQRWGHYDKNGDFIWHKNNQVTQLLRGQQTQNTLKSLINNQDLQHGQHILFVVASLQGYRLFLDAIIERLQAPALANQHSALRKTIRSFLTQGIEYLKQLKQKPEAEPQSEAATAKEPEATSAVSTPYWGLPAGTNFPAIGYSRLASRFEAIVVVPLSNTRNGHDYDLTQMIRTLRKELTVTLKDILNATTPTTSQEKQVFIEMLQAWGKAYELLKIREIAHKVEQELKNYRSIEHIKRAIAKDIAKLVAIRKMPELFSNTTTPDHSAAVFTYAMDAQHVGAVKGASHLLAKVRRSSLSLFAARCVTLATNAKPKTTSIARASSAYTSAIETASTIMQHIEHACATFKENTDHTIVLDKISRRKDTRQQPLIQALSTALRAPTITTKSTASRSSAGRTRTDPHNQHRMQAVNVSASASAGKKASAQNQSGTTGYQP